MKDNRLVARLDSLREAGESGIAPYITAGDGGLETTRATLHALEEAGAACVELGLPFSDPIADGPVLQAAAQRALDGGTTLDATLEMVTRFREEGGQLPLLLFGYANPFVKRGWMRAAEMLATAGVDGLLVPDVPIEELGPVREATVAAGITCVPFVAPTSGEARIARAAELATGFLYAIARVGVTGRSTDLDEGTLRFVEQVRNIASCPLGLGFGIRGPEQVAAVTRHADLAIVGSALVQAMHEAGQEEPNGARRASRISTRAAEYVAELRRGLSSPR